MIYVDRRRIRPPAKLFEISERATKELRDHYKQGEKYRSQRRYPFNSKAWLQYKKHLKQLFYDKCGYCESPTAAVAHGDVEHFRPKGGARGLDSKTFLPDHYWWLAYDWNNLLLICAVCNHNKRDLFPIEDESARAPIEAPQAMLDEEPRLLLDPCSRDDPETELAYAADGSVRGLTSRAQVTIDILDLNRQALCDQRKEIYHSIQQFVEIGGDLGEAFEERRDSTLKRMTRDDAPYAGAARYFVTEAGFAHLIPTRSRLDKPEHIPTAPATYDTSQLRAVWPRSIYLRNFKAIHELELQFPTPNADYAPWLALVGPNAVGKSSVLEAMALVLANDALRDKLAPDARELLTEERNESEKVKADNGEIKVEFSDGTDKTLKLQKNKRRFTVLGETPKSLRVLGYGPHRLPPRPGMGRKTPRQIQVGNLFDPHVLLNDVNSWLCDDQTVNDKQFDLLSRNFRELLPIDSRSDIRRTETDLIADLFGYETPLEELSSGYRSLIALASDIMMNLSTESVNVASAQGIVLLDEIETHLHPSWKIRIVSSLRDLFPSVRFIMTTHDPLCLRGLDSGETYRLNRDPETQRIYAQQVDIPPGLTVDNLLTGSWFELDGTYDHDTQRLLDRYRDLLGSETTDRKETALVEEQLRSRFGRFAETTLERQILSVASTILKEESVQDTSELKPADFRRLLVERVRAERSSTQ